ncbi:MAG: hypothetical protein HZC25_02360 [Rhodospirillales bacterium]|nr:hypothetical protein [Rhodospirillales bacterium]
MSGDGAARLAEKNRLIADTVALRPTDKVVSVFYTMFWHAKAGGATCRDMMYDYKKSAEITKKLVLDLDPDMFSLPHPVSALGPTMELMGFKTLEWPGHGTPDNVSYQYLDREYMKPEEYDDYLFDPTGYYLSKYLPRIAEAFEGLAALPTLPSLYYVQIVHGTRYFASKEVRGAFERLAKAGDEMRSMLRVAMGFAQEMADLGYPQAQGPTAIAPFDYLGDNFRGSKGIMLDMYRRKDKLMAAMEKSIPFILKQAIEVGSRHACKMVFIPIHWAFDGFMSLEQFKTFFWPPLRKVMMGLIEKDLIPLVLWEGECSSRLETIADIPKGKCIYWFERTDLKLAKAVLGDITCLRGNVPASLLTAGTAEEVDAFCKDLIATAGKGGGLILDGGIGIPDEAKYECVRAMIESTRKYRP